MEKVLVVEDDATWQGIHKRGLEHLLGQGSVDVVVSYDVALSVLNQNYAAYVVDGEFPRRSGLKPEPLGVQLAKEVFLK